jgi:hypothetical protein
VLTGKCIQGGTRAQVLQDLQAKASQVLVS